MITANIDKKSVGNTTIFMTGSTGFIGKETVKQFMNGTAKLLLLVRSESRAREAMRNHGIGMDERIRFVEGDLSQPGLGLNDEDRKRVMEADVIIHSGGTMDVTLERKEAERIFMDGAREMAVLAEDIHKARGLRHFIHVVGYMSPYGDDDNSSLPTNRKKRATENPGKWKRWLNTMLHTESAYEHMKFEADRFIRKHAKQCSYPLSVVNPSTVVGPFPTGITEQLGGFGLLVQATRNRKMPVVPGGLHHWLPLVSNDVVAAAIVFLAGESDPTGGTFPLLSRKEVGPDMKDLIGMLASELDVSAPRGVVPLSLIHFLMKAGGSRISGIPPESLAFITAREFEVEQTERLFACMDRTMPDISALLPDVVADLDYRISYPSKETILPTGWTRTRKGELAVLSHEGEGDPWIIVHGLMSDADDMLPLGQEIWSRTGNPVWLIDLAGFGRSARRRQASETSNAFSRQVAALHRVLVEVNGPVTLVGHSIGAAICAETMRVSGRADIRLAMLQPVWGAPKDKLQRFASRLPRRMLRHVLSRMNAQRVNRMMQPTNSAGPEHALLISYAERAASGMKSPRIAGANADLLQWISRPDREVAITAEEASTTLLVWGLEDTGYEPPSGIHSEVQRVDVPHGHAFPIFHAAETAALLVEWQAGQAKHFAAASLVHV